MVVDVAPPCPACRGSGLAVALGAAQSAKFQSSASVSFTNRGSAACTLSGYPGLVFRRSGTTLPISAAHGPDRQPTVVTLQPGRTASARLIWDMYEGAGTTCPPFATQVAVTAPGQPDAVLVTWFTDPVSASICGRTVTVGPIS